ncbi:MAG: hypothetical protein LC745_04445, partial [Planctomycetia bacterium]|nr:hypothetical protein [Planctomycetia bacterium]
MSQPSRPRSDRPAKRRHRQIKFEAVQPLEDRCLLAPILALSPTLAAITPAAAPPPNTSVNTVTVSTGEPDIGFLTAAPFDSVSQLTSISSFGGDIVRIRSGPGGPFGNDVYAISRGAGENAAGLTAAQTTNNNTTQSVVTGAINRPGVIYRVDPATGNTNVFFDLNTLIPQLDANKQTNAGNSVGAATGLVNWYDITFDPEGYFDGKPSMFVSSVDRQDPAKNAVYRIAPDGKFMGMFVQFSAGFAANNLNVNPSAILVPPPEDQTFLRGLIAGGGVTSTNAGTSFSALFFNANAYSPGQVVSTTTLPKGVVQTGLINGPITGLTAANIDYTSRVYGTFTDFGTPGANGIPAQPGFSGVEGINGDFLLGGAVANPLTGAVVAAPTGIISQTPTLTTRANTLADTTVTDRYAVVTSDFRRFEDIGFDQYGYFAQGAQIGLGGTTLGVTTNGIGSVGGTGPGGGSGTGVATGVGNTSLIRPAITLP